MKYRVERARTDHGYGIGWVVMNFRGTVVLEAATHSIAIYFANTLAEAAARYVERRWVSP